MRIGLAFYQVGRWYGFKGVDMQIRNRIFTLLLLAGLLFGKIATGSELFGRVFTTPAQRAHMDELRKAVPKPGLQFVDEIIDIEEEVEEVEEQPVNSLTVRGLVYRSDGKNTAWINDSNSFEGSVSSQYIMVGDIKSNKVEIKIPGANTTVNLNVGQTFDPVSEEYRDLGGESSTTIKNSVRTEQQETPPGR
jgi:hypothetical protein